MATTLINPAAGWKAAFLQARTDSTGAAVDDTDGEDARLFFETASAGIVKPIPTGFQVLEDSPAAMIVVVGSGSAESDVAIIPGTASGQGKYIVRSQDATTDVTINAADASNPRIDEIYIIIQDNQYDTTGRVLPRLAYRDGVPSSVPVAPGPDSGWDAYLLIATINVPAGDTTIENAQITDSRVFSRMMTSGAGLPGVVEMFGGSVAPPGSLLCQGQAVSRTTFKRLFGAIGTTWGAGDGSTTFNVPDMRGRYARGVAASGTGNSLAASFGADTLVNHTHTLANHTHTIDPPSTTSGALVLGAQHGGNSTRGVYSFNELILECSPSGNSFAHTHAVNIASFSSGVPSTSATTNPTTTPEILPASKAVHFIIWT